MGLPDNSYSAHQRECRCREKTGHIPCSMLKFKPKVYISAWNHCTYSLDSRIELFSSTYHALRLNAPGGKPGELSARRTVHLTILMCPCVGLEQHTSHLKVFFRVIDQYHPKHSEHLALMNQRCSILRL